MGNNIKKEINKITIPEELHQRSVQGIFQAKQEMGLENHVSSKPYKHKSKWFIGFAAMVSLLISGSILIKGEFAKNPTTQLAQERTPIMESSPYMRENIAADKMKMDDKLYNSFSDLRNDANVIVEGDVIESITLNKEGQIQTHSKVKVWKDYKQVLKKNEVITFIEQGGLTTLGNNQAVEVMFEVPVLKLGERVLIFATKEKKEGEEVYLPLGGYQGKFMIQNDYIQRVVPDHLDGQYLSLKLAVNDFKKAIESK